MYRRVVIFKGIFETPFFLIFVVTSDPPYTAPSIQTTLTWLLWHFHFHWSLIFLHIPMKTLGRWFFSLSAEDWVIFLSDPCGLKAVCDQCLQCSVKKNLKPFPFKEKQIGNGGRNQLIVLKGTVLLICWHNCHCWSLEHEGNWKLRRRLFLKEYTATWKSGVTLQVQTGNLWGKALILVLTFCWQKVLWEGIEVLLILTSYCQCRCQFN